MGLQVLNVVWLGLVFVIAPILWKAPQRLWSERAGAAPNLVRLACRSLALAIPFAPTVVLFGFVGWPMPASLLIFLNVATGGAFCQDGSGHRDCLCFKTAVAAFLLFWAFIFLGAFVRFSRRLRRVREGTP